MADAQERITLSDPVELITKPAGGTVRGLPGLKPQRPPKASWYRIEARADAPASDVWLYDEIGCWGTSASDFVKELAALKASGITLHLNTPGGDVFDGLAIYAALKNHPASVDVVVDGLAASIGSVIAQAGDTVAMAPNAQMMIHEAHGLAAGNAKAVTEYASLLDRSSDNIASIYAQRAGGNTADWRDRMRAETWFSAQEAVAAGLADKIATAAPKNVEVSRVWNLSIFGYAGRKHADPQLPADPPVVPPAAVEQDEDVSVSGIDLSAAIRGALDDEPLPFASDYLRNVMRSAMNDSPAPRQPAPPAPVADDDDLRIDLFAVRKATR